MVSGFIPKRRTPWLSKKPDLASCMDSVSPVCPPSPGSMPSGFSRAIMRSSVGIVNGSMYIESAIALSVIMVAGLELTSTTSTPRLLSVRHACVPA